MKSHFPVKGFFDYGNKEQEATLTIDHDSGVATIRIKGRHDVVVTTAAGLASLGYQRGKRLEVQERLAGRKTRKVSRGLLTTGR